MSTKNDLCYHVKIADGEIVRVESETGDDRGGVIADDRKYATIGGWQVMILQDTFCVRKLIVKYRDNPGVDWGVQKGVLYKRTFTAENDGDLHLRLHSNGRASASYQQDNVRKTLRERFGIWVSDYANPNETYDVCWASSDMLGKRSVGWVLSDGRVTFELQDGYRVTTPYDDKLDEYSGNVKASVDGATWAIRLSMTWNDEDDRVEYDSEIHLGGPTTANTIASSLQAFLNQHAYDSIYDALDGFCL